VQPGETIEAPTMGMRVTCRESAASSNGEVLSFTLWMRGGAVPPPMHIHPHQEERITVTAGRLHSRTGASDRILSPGEEVVSPPGEVHTVGPAGAEDVEMLAELRPALAYEQFLERSFALDRAGHLNAKGRGNPLRLATAGAREAEFFVPRVPLGVQRAMLAVMVRIARRIGYDRPIRTPGTLALYESSSAACMGRSSTAAKEEPGVSSSGSLLAFGNSRGAWQLGPRNRSRLRPRATREAPPVD
jgi:mannose-6-phosphate isomerase-like protein (cupin superfamily)